jgi:dUTP pyrophosphatase
MIKTRGFEVISMLQYLKDVGMDKNHDYCNIKTPKRATRRSSGYDLYAPCSFTLLPGEDIVIPLGIKAYMLDDEELLIFPKSGISFKYGIQIANTIGKVDSDYYNNIKNEGHIFLKLVNTGNKIFDVKAGDAIAQGTFYNYLLADDDIPLCEERIGGLGSTSN